MFKHVNNSLFNKWYIFAMFGLLSHLQKLEVLGRSRNVQNVYTEAKGGTIHEEYQKWKENVEKKVNGQCNALDLKKEM